MRLVATTSSSAALDYLFHFSFTLTRTSFTECAFFTIYMIPVISYI